MNNQNLTINTLHEPAILLLHILQVTLSTEKMQTTRITGSMKM